MRAVDRAEVVHPHEALEVGEVRHVLETAPHRHPLVVHEVVDVAECLDGAIYHPPTGLGVAHVRGHHERASPACSHRCFTRVSADSSRAASTILRPRLASATASSSPIPEDAPVMTAVFPLMGHHARPPRLAHGIRARTFLLEEA